MGKKTPQQEADVATIVGAKEDAGKTTLGSLGTYLEWNSDTQADKTSKQYFDWLSWKANEITRPKFQPPTYGEAKEYPQLPVTPSAPSGAPAPTSPRGQSPQPQIINRYLEQIMSKVGGEGSGQTEVGKVLRAQAQRSAGQGGGEVT